MTKFSNFCAVLVVLCWICEQTKCENSELPISSIDLEEFNYEVGDIPEEGAVTMAFVFDVTGSMYDDLVQVIDGAAKILDTVLQRRERLLHNYVLVPFHDPDVGPATVTSDHRVFQDHLKDLYVQGGGDCPEASIAAIKLALEVCLPNSFIYVFTDASSKDYYLLQDVLTLIQRKQSQVVFVMTGDCGEPDHPGYLAYETIASTSSGQVFHLKKSDVDEVLNFVRVSLQARKVNLLAVNQVDKGEALYPLAVDSNLREFTVSLSGDNPQVELINPNGTTVKGNDGVKEILNIPNVQVVNIKDPEFGTWNVKLSSNSSHTIRATGLSPVDFVYGFSVMPTSSLQETYHRPLKGAPTNLLINATDLPMGAYFSSVELISLGGESLLNVSLEEISEQPGMFKATPFIPPNDYFYLRIQGIDELNFPMQRISPTAISSQLPGLPEVILRPPADIHTGNTISFTCQVQSLVPFDLRWFRGRDFETQLGTVESYSQTSTAVLTIVNVTTNHEDVYYCNATNIAGSAASQIYLDVREPPPQVNKLLDVSIAPGSSAFFTCSASSNSPFNLTWSRYDPGATKRRFTNELIKENSRFIDYMNGTLVIHDTHKEDEGWYRCTARNEGGPAHQRMYVSVQKSPNIVIRPATEITYIEGSSITITCESSGIPEPAIEWIRDGQLITDTQNVRAIGGTLQLYYATKELAGSFECRAHNAAGSDNKTVHLKYIAPPEIDKLKAVYKVILGDSVTLPCKVNTATPEARVQWKRGEYFLPKPKIKFQPLGPPLIRGDLPVEEEEEFDDDKFELVAGSQLKFRPQLADAGEYMCEAKNEAGIDRHVVSVVVLVPPSIFPFNEENIVAKRGDSLTLPCWTTGYPSPTITWLKDDQPVKIIADNVSLNEDTKNSKDINFEGQHENLILQDIGLSASGFYSCITSNEAGQDVFNYTIIVKDPPIILDSNQKQVESIVGERALFNCLTTGHPLPVILWHKDGVLLDPAFIILFKNGSMLIESTVVEDAGIYKCVASNEAGYDQLDVIYTVLVPPSVNSSALQQHTNVVQGNSVIFHCPVNADPAPTISWYKNDVLISNSSVKNDKEKENYFIRNNGQTLLIVEANKSDAGNYDCVAVNAAGKANVTLTLDVFLPPEFLESAYYDNLIVIENGILELECPAIGNPSPIITWLHDNHKLTLNDIAIDISEKKLTVQNIQESDAGSYICQVSNKAGTIERNFNVTVLVPPKLDGNDYETYEIAPGQSIDLLCIAKGKPTPSVTWLREDIHLDNSNERIQFKDNNRVLHLAGVSENDAGEYVCEVENEAGATSKTILLDVLVPPIVTILGVDLRNNKMKIVQKSSLEVDCSASGNPAPSLAWLKDGVSIAKTAQQHLSLKLESVDISMAGRYVCVASSAAGSSERDITVEVLVPAYIESQEIGKENVDIHQILNGLPIILHCPAGGTPTPEFHWFKDGILLNLQSDNNVVIVDNGKRLRIAQTTAENAGRYSCAAFNEAGKAEKQFQIDVLVPPSIKEEKNRDETGSSITKAILNKQLFLHCPVSSGNPAPGVTWLKDGISFNPVGDPNVRFENNFHALIINAIRSESAGRYTCVATNAAGSAEKDFLVDVLVPPEFDTPVDKMDRHPVVLLNRPITLNCPVNENSESIIVWLKDGKPITNGNDGNIVISASGRKLKIHRSHEGDRGRYTCSANNEAGEINVEFDLDVHVPPKLKAERVNSKIYAKENNSFVIECPIVGHPLPTITWLKDGQLLIGDTVNDIKLEDNNLKLVIMNALPIHDGQYTCVASNEAGAVEQNYNVVVQVPPKLDLNDLNHKPSVVLHRPITIVCPVSGSPLPTVKWLKNGKPIHQIKNPNLFVAADGRRLKLRRAHVEDAGIYKCIAYNDAGKTEQDFELTVNVPPTFKSNDDNDLDTNQNPEAVKGGTAEILCNVDGIPPPTIIWLKNGQLVHHFIQIQSEEELSSVTINASIDDEQSLSRIEMLRNGLLLRIKNISEEDEGLYTCIASNIAGSIEKNFDFEVLVPPKIVGIPHEQIQVLLNRPVIFECLVEANPPASIQWLKEDLPLKTRTFGGALIRLLNDGRQLHISRTLATDSGAYTCVATNNVGRSEKHYNLNVLVPPTVSMPNHQSAIKIGQEIALSCLVSGNPAPDITWLKDGRVLQLGTDLKNLGIILDVKGERLIIQNTSLIHSGRFTCMAANEAGASEKDFNLEIIAPPLMAKLTPRQRHLASLLNDPVKIECPIISEHFAETRWLKNGHQLDPSSDPFVHVSSDGKMLQLIHARENDAGNYQCIATNEAGQSQSDFILQILVPPKIESPLGDDSGPNYVIEDNTADFECYVSGNPTPTVSWFKDGKTLEKSVFYNTAVSFGNHFNEMQLSDENQRLHIPKAQLEDQGQYTCIANSSAGMRQRDFYLSVQVPPKIDPSISRNVTTNLHHPLALNCPILRAIPEPEITWLKNGMLLGAFTDSNLEIINKGRGLHFQRIKLSDAGKYTCLASNSAGSDNVSISLNVYVAPKIDHSNIGGPTTVVINHTLTLECPVSGNPTPAVQWFKDGQLLNEEYYGDHIRVLQQTEEEGLEPGRRRFQLFSGGQTFHLNKMQMKDEGVYECVAMNPAGHDHAKHEVDVQIPPSVARSTLSEIVQITEGQSITLPCEIIGDPQPNIIWFKDGQIIESKHKMNGQTSLHLLRVQGGDSGRYTCMGTNIAGSAEFHLDLEVLVPPSIQAIPDVPIVQIIEGNSIVFECQPNGIPFPDVSWLKNGSEIMDHPEAALFNIQLLHNNQRLHLEGAKLNHSGQYTCVVENSVGVAHHNFILEILVPPRFNNTYLESNYTGLQNENITLDCPVTGIPQPRILWYKDARLVLSNGRMVITNNGTLLTLSKLRLADKGLYSCLASNDAGTEEKEMTVDVLVPPSIDGSPNEPELQVVVAYQTAVLECLTKGIPPPTITWFKNEDPIPADFHGRFLVTDKGRFLKIVNSLPQDDDVYSCLAENEAGAVEKAFRLDVIVPPGIDLPQPIQLLQVATGHPLAIECPVKGDPLPKITWLKNGHPLETSERLSILKKGQVVYLESALPIDKGDYTCLATNEAGNSQQEFVIQILVPPTIKGYVDVIDDISVIAYHFLRIECPAVGNPLPEIRWSKDGVKLNTSSSPLSLYDFQLLFGSTLQVHRALPSHSGVYTCEAFNTAGTAQKSYNVSVWRLPVFLNDFIQHLQISRKANEDVLFSCLSDGIPMPMIAWYKDDQPLLLTSINNDTLLNDGHELLLSKVDLADSGHYRCVANNLAGNSSKEFTLNVLKPPTLENAPNAHIRVIINERVDLPCHATGTPNPRITWSRISLSLLESSGGHHPHSVGSTLTFPAVRLQDEGVYMCSATNDAGTINHNVTLEVQVPPSISDGPSDVSVIKGQDAILSCHAKGRPSPKVIWKKDSDVIENKHGYSSLPDGSLSVNNASLQQAGTYTCVAMNDAGSKHVHRLLRVHETPHILPGQQQRYITIRGQDATLGCLSTGHPLPQTIWERNGEAIDLRDQNFGLLSDGGLRISSAGSSDMGTYRCSVQNVAGIDVRDVELIVMIPPKIDVSAVNSKQFVTRGFSLRIPCRATGYPFPTTLWLRDGVHVDAGANGDLHLEQIKVEDGGKYVCRAVNEAGRDHVEILIEVHVPPAITSTPTSQQVALGGKAQFTCGAEGMPPPTFTWFHNEKAVLGHTSASNGKSTLALENVQFDDAGTYTCMASSVAGEKRVEALLTILVPPRIVHPPGEHSVKRGESFAFSCDAEGDPYPSIFWTKNGQRLDSQGLADEGYYFLDDVQPTDAGIYNCIATNTAGIAEGSGSLVVLVDPEIVIKPRDTVVELGTSSILDCQAIGTPLPVVQWTKDGVPRGSAEQNTIVLANSSLQLIAVQLEDEGVYECIATSSLGSETAAKAKVSVMVHGLWSTWSQWGSCSVTCDLGIQTRQRSCNNPPPRHGGQVCAGISQESRACMDQACPINGAWSEWNMWHACSATCGNGIRARTRNCDAPTPSNGGRSCSGDIEEIENCFVKECPINGGWNAWSHWMSCSATCGDGVRKRNRICNNPPTQHGGQECQGNSTETRHCIINNCEIHGEWSQWGIWSPCSQSCSGGVRERSRSCDSPAPQHGGRDCSGLSSQIDYCHNDPCPIHGNWGSWSSWGECSVSCNGGQRRRFRACNSPSPSYGGRTCAGPGQDTEACNVHQCPEHGNWAPWSEWSTCSASCGSEGIRQRYRSCTNPPPRYGGRRCAGDDSQVEQCARQLCQGTPLLSIGNLLGAINGQDIGLSPIIANITKFGAHTTVTATIGNLPSEAANWIRVLPSLISPIYWTMAYELDQAANGYTLTKGYFLRDTQVAFATGEIVKMTHVARGLDSSGAFLVDVVISGDVPDFSFDEDIVIDKYIEEYIQTGPDSLNAMSTRTFQTSGYILPYAWNHSIRYDELNGRMPYLVQLLHVDDIQVNYDEQNEELGLIVSAAITKGSPSNRCPDGFTLHSGGLFCEDKDECTIQNPCSHGCSNTPGSFLCFCPSGYTLGPDGQNCQDVDECQLGINDCFPPSECENTIGSFRCLAGCGPGFQRTASGLGCQDINECTEQPKVCDQLCLNLMGGYRCDCNTGYRLIGGATCKDIDECEQIDSPCSHECRNTPGSFICSCPNGFSLIDNEQCEDENECLSGNHNCNRQQECQNTVGSFKCVNLCKKGFTLHHNGTCIDIDECRLGQSMCHASQLCENTPGSYRCICPRGFQSLGSGQPCQDVDECQNGINPCTYQCHNTRGDYECICPPGQKRLSDRKSCAGLHYVQNKNKSSRLLALESGSRQSSRTFQRCAPGFHWVDGWCKDFDECSTEGRCQHACVNTIGSYKCICPLGYSLNSNGRTCQDIDECVEEEVDCGRDKTCFNTRGSFQCIDAPCPPLFEREKVTGDCVLPCDRSDVPCPPGVKYAEILAYKMVSLASGIQAYQDLLRLVAYDQDGQHMPNTEFTVVENDGGVPFQIRRENGKGVLFTLRVLDSGREYSAVILATSYDPSRTVVHYTTKFLVYISVAEFPY